LKVGEHFYVELLQQHRLQISMTQSGSPYDNAIAERINGILKTEFGLRSTFESFTAAKQAVDQAIEKYNYLRPYFSCDLKAPQYRHAAPHVKPIQENLLKRQVILGKSDSVVKQNQ
jgi:putative transposase